jgi:hypothetical protein
MIVWVLVGVCAVWAAFRFWAIGSSVITINARSSPTTEHMR